MTRHLWDITRKNDSLWVKWCHTFMLRENSLWNCSRTCSISWVWRKLLKLKGKVVDFIKYIVGNGETIQFWVDNWHPLGLLVNKFNTRIMYDVASSISARVSSFIEHIGWQFPVSTSRDLQLINFNLPNYRPNTATEDVICLVAYC